MIERTQDWVEYRRQKRTQERYGRERLRDREERWVALFEVGYPSRMMTGSWREVVHLIFEKTGRAKESGLRPRGGRSKGGCWRATEEHVAGNIMLIF